MIELKKINRLTGTKSTQKIESQQNKLSKYLWVLRGGNFLGGLRFLLNLLLLASLVAMVTTGGLVEVGHGLEDAGSQVVVLGEEGGVLHAPLLHLHVVGGRVRRHDRPYLAVCLFII